MTEPIWISDWLGSGGQTWRSRAEEAGAEVEALRLLYHETNGFLVVAEAELRLANSRPISAREWQVVRGSALAAIIRARTLTRHLLQGSAGHDDDFLDQEAEIAEAAFSTLLKLCAVRAEAGP